jgi:hypothetical protein
MSYENLDKMNRSQLEEYYVNLYRENWNTNQGLNTELKNLSKSELKILIKNQLGFKEVTRKNFNRIP